MSLSEQFAKRVDGTLIIPQKEQGIHFKLVFLNEDDYHRWIKHQMLIGAEEFKEYLEAKAKRNVKGVGR